MCEIGRCASGQGLPRTCGVLARHQGLGGGSLRASFQMLCLQEQISVQAALAHLHAVPMRLGLAPALLLRSARCLFGFALWQLLAQLVWRLCDAEQCLKRHWARLPALQLLGLGAAALRLLLYREVGRS